MSRLCLFEGVDASCGRQCGSLALLSSPRGHRHADAHARRRCHGAGVTDKQVMAASGLRQVAQQVLHKGRSAYYVDNLQTNRWERERRAAQSCAIASDRALHLAAHPSGWVCCHTLMLSHTVIRLQVPALPRHGRHHLPRVQRPRHAAHRPRGSQVVRGSCPRVSKNTHTYTRARRWGRWQGATGSSTQHHERTHMQRAAGGCWPPGWLEQGGGAVAGVGVSVAALPTCHRTPLAWVGVQAGHCSVGAAWVPECRLQACHGLAVGGQCLLSCVFCIHRPCQGAWHVCSCRSCTATATTPGVGAG
jgi:hypothetical protein